MAVANRISVALVVEVKDILFQTKIVPLEGANVKAMAGIGHFVSCCEKGKPVSRPKVLRKRTGGNSIAIEYVDLQVYVETETSNKIGVSKYKLCVIEHKPVSLLLDTGACVSILNKETCEFINKFNPTF